MGDEFGMYQGCESFEESCMKLVYALLVEQWT
jgi:hypothetical protein